MNLLQFKEDSNRKIWVFGGLIGFLGPYLITYAFYKFRGVVGLGGGDIKLFGILGLILGPMGILSNIFMSCLLGSVVGLGLIVGNKMGKISAWYDNEWGFSNRMCDIAEYVSKIK